VAASSDISEQMRFPLALLMYQLSFLNRIKGKKNQGFKREEKT
jgi:hypothetical protein